jgi:hypothetical protein
MKGCAAALGFVIALVSLSATPALAATNLVQNGSFESGFPTNPDNRGWQSVGYNGSSGALIPHWSQTGGGVNWHDNVPDAGTPAAHDGERFIDLVSGGGLGKLEQVIPTITGMYYTLSFFYTANRACVGAAEVTARATAGGASLDVQSNGRNDYKPATLAFTASDTSTTITFEGLGSGAACPGGVTIDNVSVLSDGSPAVCTPSPGPPPPGGIPCGTGTSAIHGATGCQGPPFHVRISGDQIERVIFTMDGKIVKVLRRPNRATQYVLAVDPRRLRLGTHRVLARVIYTARSGTSNTTLRDVFSRCTRKATASPDFDDDATRCDGARVDIVQLRSKLKRAPRRGKRHSQLTAALRKAESDRRHYCPPA